MAFGFPASYSESVTIDASDTGYKNTVKGTLDSLSWSIQSESDGQIVAKSSVSFWSWGEKVIVDFFEGESVSVTSKCYFQVFDWGKNKQNVARFISELDDNPDVKPER